MVNKKFLPYLLLGIIGIIISALYIFAINPEENFSISNFSLSPIPFIFFFIFVTITSLFAFVLKNLRRGILIGFFVVGIMLLQFFNYSNVIYPILLFIILLLVEFLFFNKKN